LPETESTPNLVMNGDAETLREKKNCQEWVAAAIPNMYYWVPVGEGTGGQRRIAGRFIRLLTGNHVRMRKPGFEGIFLALLLIAPTSSCVRNKPGKVGGEPVRILIVPHLSSAPLYIAVDGGHLAAQGIDAETIKMDQSAKALPALIQGGLDVWGGTLSLGILNAIARGANIRIVADKGYIPADGCAYSGLVAGKPIADSGMPGRLDLLRGRRVAIQNANFEGYFLDRLFGLAQLKASEVELVDIPHEAEPGALETGRIDFTAATEPWVTRAIEAGCGTLWMPAGNVIPDFQFACLVYGPSLLEKNPDLGRRFMIAYLAAVRQYNEGKSERNLEILARRTGLDRNFLLRACWPSFRPDGRINTQSVMDFQAWGRNMGFLDRPVAVEDFWNPGFIKQAHGNEPAIRQ
jgi:NitT/TauT family transport system substrate-binding protein